MKDFIISCLISCIYNIAQTMFSKYLWKTLWNLSQGFMEFVLLFGIHCNFDNGHVCLLAYLFYIYICGLVFEQIELIKISRLI